MATPDNHWLALSVRRPTNPTGLSEVHDTLTGMKRAYTALSSTTDRESDLSLGLRWAQELAEPGQQVALWCYDKDDLPRNLAQAASALNIIIHSERPRPRGGLHRRFNGPVVAVGLPLETLTEVEPFAHPVCLVHAYVPENDEKEWAGLGDLPFDRPWVDAFTPECLAGPAIVPNDPLIEDVVIARAMETFTATTFGGTTMYDSRDGGRVTHGLLELRRGGHRIKPELLFSAALRAGWKGTQALKLRSVAREVANGVNKRPKASYGDGMLSRWREEADSRRSTF